jgi:hypothetical protein
MAEKKNFSKNNFSKNKFSEKNKSPEKNKLSEKNLPEKKAKQYLELLYMTPEEVTAQELAALFQEMRTITVELWAEMNVMELELANENTIDFEPVDPIFKDPSDAAFVKNRSIKTIYAINLCEDDVKAATEYFELIVNRYSGFVCADTEDFSPVYAGTSKK